MKNSKRLAYLARKLGFTLHKRYKELCALAASGQLGGPQMYELNEHIRACADCREFLESVGQSSTQIVAPLSEYQAPAADDSLPSGMRARFISRLASNDSEPQLSFSRALEHRLFVPWGNLPNRPAVKVEFQKSFGGANLRRLVAALAVCAICALVGFYFGERISVPILADGWSGNKAPARNIVSSVGTHLQLTGAVGQIERDQLAHDKKELERQLAALTVKLSSAQTEQRALVEKLASANARRALAEQVQGVAQASSQTAQPTEQLTRLEKEGETLRERLAEVQAILVEQESATRDAHAKLDSALDELHRERDLESAKSQLGDLAGARNLHIVDVYDADARGKRQPAFGRVFYVEGKSLVFCAYDLERSHRLSTNVVFHVWGGKAGGKETTHNLGILHNDATVQDRWVMTFDDPAVLAQINSVFVTAESANKTSDSPRGKKVLYAYLGSSPNHP
jgi:hypothetical protein